SARPLRVRSQSLAWMALVPARTFMNRMHILAARCHSINATLTMPLPRTFVRLTLPAFPAKNLVHCPDDHARLLAGEPVIDDLAVAARGDETVGAQPRELL